MAYRADLDQFLAFLAKGGITSLLALSLDDITHYQKEMEDLRYASTTITRKMQSLRVFLQFLYERGSLPALLPIQLPKAKSKPSVPRWLSSLERRALRDGARRDVRLLLVISLMINEGLRLSEVAGLHMAHLGKGEKEVLVLGLGQRVDRTLLLSNESQEAIRAYLQLRPRVRETTLLLTKNCRPFQLRNIRLALTRVMQFVGLENASIADLRHTYILDSLSQGKTVPEVQILAGLPTQATVQRYLEHLEQLSARGNGPRLVVPA